LTEQDLDLNLLKTLEILFEEKSVSRSAKRLGVSQAAVSVQLSKLRAHFEDVLFNPSRNGLLPTAFALTLIEPLRELMQCSRTLISQRQNFDPMTTRRRFRVEAGYIDTTITFSIVSRRLAALAPNISISYSESAGLRDNTDLDFCVLPDGLQHGGAWSWQAMYTDRYVCLIDRDNRLFGESISETEYLEATHIVRRRLGSDGYSSLEALLMKRMGCHRKEGPVIDNYGVIPSLLNGTNYISTVSLHFAEYLARLFPLRILELPIPLPKQTLLLLWRPMLDGDMTAQWLREQICASAREVYGALAAVD
jgi:DNA-binding transcriptional LysR family regulator